MGVRYNSTTGQPSGVVLTVQDMRGRRTDPNEQPSGVFKLQFRDADGFDVMLILTSVADVVQLRQLLV
jgi:hypothetical protein